MDEKRKKAGNCTKLPLDYEELRARFLTVPDMEHRLMACIALVTGPRVTEITTMLRCDIDNGYIRVRRTKRRKSRNGGMKKEFEFRKYPIPIPAWLQGVMDATLPYLKRKPDDFLFQSRFHGKKRPGKQLTPEGANKILRSKAFAGVETPGQLPTAHTIRKSVAQHLYIQENDYEMPRKHLDHKSPSTTFRYLDQSRRAYESVVRAAL